MKNENGMTLIGLVLVGLVLLILAAISISLVVTSDQNQAENVNTKLPVYIDDSTNIEDEEGDSVENPLENTIDNTVENTTDNLVDNKVEEANIVEE